jgi:urease accessory protein
MKKLAILSIALAAVASPALAHPGHGLPSGFGAGLLHPLTGADHLLAMVAVGLWSGFALPRHVWAGAAAFLSAMVAGAAFAWAGGAIPMVETWITASVVVFGLLTLSARPGQDRRLTTASLAAIAGFAVCHGYAHAAEATGQAAAFLAGFLATTAALHLVGIGLARTVASGRAARLVQGGLGAMVALGGLAMLAG